MYLTRDDFKLNYSVAIVKTITLVSGIKLEPCVIKTVSESVSPAVKLNFNFKASVIRKFHTSFIVKLYGVVSEGQPVHINMETMKKGNLRDPLRSYRPNSESNVDNKPILTLQNFTNWAAQKADGMSYLESYKLCHRDLAARYCLIHRNEIVKIGNFDMARDIYYHEYYQLTGKRLIPVRLMNQESLKDDNPEVFEYIVKSRKIYQAHRDVLIFGIIQ
uniref:Insulin-like growth factor 1 receptor (inferred by orthology to a human protein) n=1 Tax=Strongyloides venezuelensis TaxID=75913 RepID=A0A0K0FI84_STRVS